MTENKVCENHSWGLWKSYDPYVIEMEITNGYRYHRTCDIYGCNAHEYAENLSVIGKNLVTDNHINFNMSR